jgi:hypothetical protein
VIEHGGTVFARYPALDFGHFTINEVKTMKHTLWNTITCSGLLLFSFAAGQAAAQYQDDDAWHRSREEFYAGNSWKMHMFDRIRADLDHVQAMAFSRKDEDRIVETKEKVSELQGRMAEGRYDQPELDRVITNLERVVADNRLATRDRDILMDDLSRVRDYRAHHDNWR